LSSVENKLKHVEEAFNELKQKVPNEISEKIEELLKKKLTDANSNNLTSQQLPPPPPPPSIGIVSACLFVSSL
jgi:hypothetical protein